MRGIPNRAILSGSAGALVCLLLLLPSGAIADCGVTETGIPADAVAGLDAFGIRQAAAGSGVSVGGTYYGELFTNSGGVDRGTEYDGALKLYMNADMHKLGFWDGLCFSASAFQIHGNSITAANVGSLMSVSGIEATDATRLFEIWFEQSLLNDTVNVRFGQLAVDAEFILSEGGAWFLNATWGWPSIGAANLPNGGPAYPLSAPAVRVAINPNDTFGLMVAVYNGDPAGPNCTGDPQVCNDHGSDFRISDPPLLFAEGVYRYNQKGRGGVIKLGGWNHFGEFSDQRFDSGGALIAVTSNDGRPLDNTWGLYGVIDQWLWRMPGQERKGAAVFARFIGAPEDRNLIDFYADTGITFIGMIPGRPEDALAIGFAYTRISDDVHAYDVDFGLSVARSYEALVELTYTMQLKNGWTLQPDLQYIWQPGGNVTDDSGRRIKDATIAGLRTTIQF